MILPDDRETSVRPPITGGLRFAVLVKLGEFLQFWEEDREGLFARFAVELESDIDSVVSQSQRDGQFPLVPIDMGNRSGNGDDVVSYLNTRRRKLIDSPGLDLK